MFEGQLGSASSGTQRWRGCFLITCRALASNSITANKGRGQGKRGLVLHTSEPGWLLLAFSVLIRDSPPAGDMPVAQGSSVVPFLLSLGRYRMRSCSDSAPGSLSCFRNLQGQPLWMPCRGSSSSSQPPSIPDGEWTALLGKPCTSSRQVPAIFPGVSVYGPQA